jgi:feruloyl esterase
VGQQAHRDEKAFIPEAKFSLLHKAALAACDALDGVKDGVIENPMKCQFDPKVLACKDGDGANCLNAEQVETARRIYAGPSAGGHNIFPGLEPGSETGWNTLSGPKAMSLAVEVYKYAALGYTTDGKWDVKDFTVADIERFEKEKGRETNSVDPNLKPFFAAKGKLLIYHGWADPGVPPMGSVNYFNSVIETVGPAAKDSIRMFMVPGMGHCGGGDGTSTFSMVPALEKWVEQGQAPERIEASRVRDGKVDRTRPLCAFPKVAVYNGSGSTDDTANFSCQ